MALNMLDAMLQELRDEDKNASEDTIKRYRMKWENAAKMKESPRTWPYPRCFAKNGCVPGKLTLIDPCDGVADAVCNKCGPLPIDFNTPE